MSASTSQSLITACIRCLFILATLVITLSTALPQPPNDTTDRTSDERMKESCEAIPYAQEIKVTGCKTRTIENHYCKGSCISGYVPENGVNGKYQCTSCQPSKTTRKIVELECEGGINKLVKVEIFLSCKCQQSNCNPLQTSPGSGDTEGRNNSQKNTKQPSTSSTEGKAKTDEEEEEEEEEEELYDPERPCRYICRKCRKSRREYDVLQMKKEKYEYLVQSCRTPECHAKIPQEDVIGVAKIQKRIKKAVCKECRDCKRRKRQGLNA